MHTASAEDCPYPDFTARYKVTTNGLTVANTSVQMRSKSNGTNKICDYQEVSTPRGIAALLSEKRYQHSTFYYNNHGIQSLTYSASQKGGDEDKNVMLEFLWDQNKVVNTQEPNPWSIKLPDGTLDMLTMTLGIAEALKKGEKDISLLVATRGRIKNYQFSTGEKTTIEVLGMKQSTQQVIRTDDKKDQTWIWFSPQYHYLPVMYEKKKKGGLRIKATLEMLNFTEPEQKLPTPPN